jgi:hypothetical protein
MMLVLPTLIFWNCRKRLQAKKNGLAFQSSRHDTLDERAIHRTINIGRLRALLLRMKWILTTQTRLALVCGLMASVFTMIPLTQVALLASVPSDQAFIPFDTIGTVVHFGSRVLPTEWEKTHLPIILLTSEDWNPSKEMLRNGDQSREFKEMRTIQSLTSGMRTR